MKQARIWLVICTILVFSFMLTSCFANVDEIIIKVHFQIIYGDQKTDLYSGGWFYYNITVTNGGSSELNATYTVTVYNPDGSINGYPRDFRLDLKPNETGVLYPNNTRFSSDDVDAHTADTVGTYEINVTSNMIGVIFYRYENENGYTWLPNSCQMSIDAMPSYQEKLNNQTSQFYQQNQKYFEDYQDYIQKFKEYADASNAEASKTRILSYFTLFISVIAVVTSYFAIPKDEHWNKRIFLLYTLMGSIIVLLLIILFT